MITIYALHGINDSGEAEASVALNQEHAMSLYNDDRCPITGAEFEDVWVYSNDRGWYWRVDYLCAGPFASEAFAFAHAANGAKKYAEALGVSA